MNEGKERKERHPRRGKGDIKERIAKEKGREGERERERGDSKRRTLKTIGFFPECVAKGSRL